MHGRRSLLTACRSSCKNGDVVSRSCRLHGYQLYCQSYHSHHFWMNGSRLILDHSFCRNSFIGRRELDFSSCSVFMTTLSSLVIFPLEQRAISLQTVFQQH